MALRPRTATQQGFTLIELLVVIGIIAILLAISIVAINPAKHFQDARNSQRQANISSILDAIYEYEAANQGKNPTNMSTVTTTPTALSKTGIDLCAAPPAGLVPTYIADLPTDPSTGTVTGGSTPCAAGVTAYDTKYTLSANTAGNRYTVSATGEPSGTISITR